MHAPAALRGWLLVVLLCGPAAAAEPARPAPRPLPDHPGNIFLAGEEVVIDCPGPDGPWRAVDCDGRPVAEGDGAGRGRLGRLPVGYYEVHCGKDARPIPLAVLQPLAGPTPASSPIACDVALAWFYPEAKMPAVSNLCALAGLNWVRDRLNWAHVETARGTFAAKTRYDASAEAQSAAGLQVLQVNHISPGWANPDHKRFPPDLRDAWRFHREVAARWRGKVHAFEPWNEADIPMFGGHTGAEIASMQKASYWGLKAGNPECIVGQNVFAVNQRAILDDFHANQAWPYFDTMNLHHYAGFDQYPRIYADFRAVSAGRPLWVTECNVPVKWSGDEKLKEPTPADLRVQAERVAKVFAGSLHEGSAATFYFLLPHYVEGQTQFGVIRPDLTPRPAFVALAAAGRLLADARPLGKLRAKDPAVRGFLFAAKPDGKDCVVLAVYTTTGTSRWHLPAAPSAVFDHLGRGRATAAELELSSAPRFVLLPAGAQGQFDLEPPPQPAPRLEGKPSPVVLQAVWPQDRTAREQSAYRVSPERAEKIPVFVYNFGPTAVEGRLDVTSPQGWKVSLPQPIRVPAGERQELAMAVEAGKPAPAGVNTVLVHGDFGPAGKPLLSLRLLPEAAKKPSPK